MAISRKSLPVFVVLFILSVSFAIGSAVFAEDRKSGGYKELVPGSAPAEELIPSSEALTIADAFLGEELTYRIGFWIFDDIAEGKVSLTQDENGDYLAILEAQTTGVVGFILRYRKDTYVARLRLSEDGSRFITSTFEKTVNKSGMVRRGITKLDYEKRLMTWRSWGGGKEEKTGEERIPPDIYTDDPLAAFYNFRYGVYGTIGEGKEFRILTFPKKDRVPEIFVRVATRDEMGKRVVQDKPYADYLADARIDKELFGQKSGDIEILFTGGMLPVYAVAKDVAIYGDVKGRLTEITKAVGFVKSPSREVTEESVIDNAPSSPIEEDGEGHAGE